MKKALKVTGIIVVVLLVAVAGLASYIKFGLPNVGDAPDIKVEASSERVARGKYLANHVMVCMDCHSTRNWNVFSGTPVPGTLGKGGDVFDQKMGFPGVYYASNITPAGIGDWTDGEIFRAITSGVRKNDKPIFPVMPHKNYGQLSEEDIFSVIAYVRTLEPIENKVPESVSDFPMNFIINTIPSKPLLSAKPSINDEVAYGKYMVTAAACAECHTPMEKGKPKEGMEFAGGNVYPMPAGLLTSANLTPDPETGLGKWSKESFINRFAIYRDSAVAHKKVDFMKEFNSIMPWTMYSGMSDQDLGAIYEYLKTVKPIKNKVEKFRPHGLK
jgi:mono/diheme cytochrome c family protein